MGRIVWVVGGCAAALFGLQACGDSDSTQKQPASGGAAQAGSPSNGGGGTDSGGATTGAGGGAAGDACVPDVQDDSVVCGNFTVGKGAACDLCVQTQCTAHNDQCCHRAMGCSSPTYTYRVMIARCIQDSCGATCGVACEDWPVLPLQ